MSINYVIACWSGLRRVNPEAYVKDRCTFLRTHVESLVRLEHKLDQITIVVANNPDEPAAYRKYIESLPKVIRTAKVVVIERPNVGYSYGAYNDVFKRYGYSFDKYLLMEDDYVFFKNGFDAEMERVLESDPKCGFLSFVLDKGTREWMTGRAATEAPRKAATARAVSEYCPDTFVFPRVAVGLARSEALGAIVSKFGQLPHAGGVNHTECKFEGQFSLSLVFQKVGWGVSDMLPRYRVEAFGPGGEKLKYGPADKELYLSSIQFLNG